MREKNQNALCFQIKECWWAIVLAVCYQEGINYYPYLLRNNFYYENSEKTVESLIDIGEKMICKTKEEFWEKCLDEYDYLEKYLGLRVSLQKAIGYGKEEYRKCIEEGKYIAIFSDTYKCEWNVFYKAQHYPHFFLLQSIDEDECKILEPIMKSAERTIRFEDLKKVAELVIIFEKNEDSMLPFDPYRVYLERRSFLFREHVAAINLLLKDLTKWMELNGSMDAFLNDVDIQFVSRTLVVARQKTECMLECFMHYRYDSGPVLNIIQSEVLCWKRISTLYTKSCFLYGMQRKELLQAVCDELERIVRIIEHRDQLLSLKKSKYVYEFYNNGNCYVYNAKNDKLYQLPGKKIDLEESSNTFINKLYDSGVLVEKNEDETQQVLQKTKDVVEKQNSLRITILPTYDCNLNCVYCLQTPEKRRMSKNTVENMLTFIEASLEGYNELNVCWFGGEPLLEYERILYVMKCLKKICSAKGVLLVGSIATNGYELTSKRFRELKSVNVVNYQITVDGPREIHDKTRPLKNGEGSFDRIVENIMNIQKENPLSYYRIIIRMNISKQSVDCIDTYVHIWEAKMQQDKRFRFLIVPVSDWGGERIKQVKSDLLEERYPLSDSYKKFYDSGLEISEEEKGVLGLGLCYAINSYNYVIDYDGYVYRCHNMTEKKDHNNAAYLGRVEEGFKAIQKRMEQVKGDTLQLKTTECRECYLMPKCQLSRCPLTAMKGEHQCLKKKINIEDKLNMSIFLEKYEVLT